MSRLEGDACRVARRHGRSSKSVAHLLGRLGIRALTMAEIGSVKRIRILFLRICGEFGLRFTPRALLLACQFRRLLFRRSFQVDGVAALQRHAWPVSSTSEAAEAGIEEDETLQLHTILDETGSARKGISDTCRDDGLL
jgi:hypothetical protein